MGQKKDYLNDRTLYPDIPMTENDKKYIESIDFSRYWEWTNIDLTRAESREAYDLLKRESVRMYHTEEGMAGDI
jgi:hypothetical protein